MSNIPFSFQNAAGETLDGALEIGAPPSRAYAVFAHCFTCDKSSRAAVRISRVLAARGIGVLRFDFTGLGESEGEFGEGLSRDADDIACAVRAMEGTGRPVQLLIGHSFGGAAVLAVAGRLDGIRAVAVIGAPFDPEHVLKHLEAPGSGAKGAETGAVTIGGRPFKLSAGFAENIRSHNQQPRLASLNKALLVLHSPTDDVVSIEHASKVFLAARHPKSFISLDDAGHLLGRRQDADYVATCIAAWAEPYLRKVENDRPAADGGVRIEETGAGKFQVMVTTPAAQFFADEPRDVGGLDSGPTPFELVGAGLGVCTAMTCRLYADRKAWPLARTTVEIHNGPTVAGRRSFVRQVGFEGDLDTAQRTRLLEIANKCPVHRALEAGMDVTAQAPPTPGEERPAEAEHLSHASAMDETCRSADPTEMTENEE